MKYIEEIDRVIFEVCARTRARLETRVVYYVSYISRFLCAQKAEEPTLKITFEVPHFPLKPFRVSILSILKAFLPKTQTGISEGS